MIEGKIKKQDFLVPQFRQQSLKKHLF